MRKPVYIPSLTVDDFIRARKYDGIAPEVYSFLRDVVDAVACPVPNGEKESFALVLAAVYNVGRRNGIREERQRRKHPGGVKTTPAPNDPREVSA